MKNVSFLLLFVVIFSCKKTALNDQGTVSKGNLDTTVSSTPVIVSSAPQLSSVQKLSQSLSYIDTLPIYSVNPIIYNLPLKNNNPVSKGTLITGTNALFRFLNVRDVIEKTSSPGFVIGQSVDYGPENAVVTVANVASVEFMFSGTQFDILMLGYGSGEGNIELEIDDVLTNQVGYPAPSVTDGQKHYINIKFSSAVVNKHVKIIYSGSTPFGGIVPDGAAKITAYTPTHTSKMVVFGDSYTSGTGTNSNFCEFYSYRVGDLLGIDNTIISGVGGTGYLNPDKAANRKTFIERVNDVILAKPDAVIVAGGINDVRYGTVDDLANASLTLFKAIRSALPNTTIIVIGPWWANGDTYPTAYAAALKQSSDAVGGYYVDNSTWITGYGNAGAPNGSGNADIYISSDGTHPTPAGHAYLAQKIAAQVKNNIFYYRALNR